MLPQPLQRTPEYRPGQKTYRCLGDQHTDGGVASTLAEKGHLYPRLSQQPWEPEQDQHRHGQQKAAAALVVAPLVLRSSGVQSGFLLDFRQRMAEGRLPAFKLLGSVFAPLFLQPLAELLLAALLLLLYCVHSAGHHILHGEGGAGILFRCFLGGGGL